MVTIQWLPIKEEDELLKIAKEKSWEATQQGAVLGVIGPATGSRRNAPEAHYPELSLGDEIAVSRLAVAAVCGQLPQWLDPVKRNVHRFLMALGRYARWVIWRIRVNLAGALSEPQPG